MKSETELFVTKPDSVLEKISEFITEDNPEWEGTSSELIEMIPGLVDKFMTAFEKSCRLLEGYKAQHPGEELPTEKESVLSKLKSYQAEAKTTARKDPEKQKKKETER